MSKAQWQPKCQRKRKAKARPEISGTIENFDQYDAVFLGYPIWWEEAARILDTYVESYDFTGKMVIPFCTSASSGIGSSADTLENLAGSGNWMDSDLTEVRPWMKYWSGRASLNS